MARHLITRPGAEGDVEIEADKVAIGEGGRLLLFRTETTYSSGKSNGFDVLVAAFAEWASFETLPDATSAAAPTGDSPL